MPSHRYHVILCCFISLCLFSNFKEEARKGKVQYNKRKHANLLPCVALTNTAYLLKKMPITKNYAYSNISSKTFTVIVICCCLERHLSKRRSLLYLRHLIEGAERTRLCS